MDLWSSFSGWAAAAALLGLVIGAIFGLVRKQMKTGIAIALFGAFIAWQITTRGAFLLSMVSWISGLVLKLGKGLFQI